MGAAEAVHNLFCGRDGAVDLVFFHHSQQGFTAQFGCSKHFVQARKADLIQPVAGAISPDAVVDGGPADARLHERVDEAGEAFHIVQDDDQEFVACRCHGISGKRCGIGGFAFTMGVCFARYCSK